MNRSKRSWVPAVLFTIAFILQSIGTVRYVRRLPNDWVGIVLYVTTTVLFAVVALGFYLRWLKEREEKGH
jgi:hypothetical protein